MLKLISSLKIDAPFTSYPLAEEFGAFKLKSATSHSKGGSVGQRFFKESFPTRQEALDFINKQRPKGEAVLVITQLSGGRIELEVYE